MDEKKMKAIIGDAVHDAISIEIKKVHEVVQLAVSTAVKDLQDKVTALEGKLESITNTNESLIDENTQLKKELSKVAVTSAMQDITREMYSRKWNIILHGIPGLPKEEELTTENTVRQMAVEHLKIDNAMDKTQHPFAACHRLSGAKDAGIIIKFGNLTSKNHWLASAKNLKNSSMNISISPDTPRCLKELRTEILNYRKKLQPEQKKAAKIQYSQTWPFITLKLGDGSHYKPKFCAEDLVNRYYGHHAANFDYNHNHIRL
jgi:hypothetical protein